MELLTRNSFEGWMQNPRTPRPSGRASAGYEGAGATTAVPVRRHPPFDNQDLCMLLQISKRTLQRYRSEGALSYKTLGKKTYYSETDVLDFLSKHVKDFRQNDIEFYKARIRNMFNK